KALSQKQESPDFSRGECQEFISTIHCGSLIAAAVINVNLKSVPPHNLDNYCFQEWKNTQ
ncbi:MAG: hypothetical protein ACUVXA_18680, partial [Candidatus Jordarchaeum sp.]|uniref:hypothetical protein n=1 Tax=Candidatus Jordarchaeum sp. TaxID=2823881 RepID=UPI004048F58C